MYTKVLILVVAVVAVSAYPGHVEHVVDYHAPAQYEFKYGVSDHHTGDEKEHSEVRHGDVVKGQYSLREPDGTIRIVKYTADKHNGFNAIVERQGHAVHPQIVHKAVVAAPIAISHGGIELGGLGGLGGHGGEALSFAGGHLGLGLGGGHGHGY